MFINFYFKISTNNFMRQPNPERGLFMDIQKKQFMNIYDSLMVFFD